MLIKSKIMERCLILNDELFSVPEFLNESLNVDDLNVRLDLNKYNKDMITWWEWMQNVWHKICETNECVVNIINAPRYVSRKSTKTNWIYQIACNGFLQKARIVTVHTGNRTANWFKKLLQSNVIINTSIQCVTSLNDIDIDSVDVIIVDEVNHIANQLQLASCCKQLLKKGGMVFFFGTGMTKEFHDLPVNIFTKTVTEDDLT